METLTVITPCARPQNLPRIAREVGAQAPWELFDYTWLIVHDCLSGPCSGAGAPPHPASSMAHHADGGSVAGHAQTNYALHRIDRGLVWQLDDDNLPAPGFFAELARQAARHPWAGAYLFGQVAERRAGTTRPSGPRTTAWSRRSPYSARWTPPSTWCAARSSGRSGAP